MIFYKYKSLSTKKDFKYLVDSLVKKYFYFSRPDELNDPFDCFIPKNYVYDSEEDLKTFIARVNANKNNPFPISIEYMKNRLETKQYEKLDYLFANHLHIFSLSDSCDNYKGICLGYKTITCDNQILLEINSSTARKIYKDWIIQNNNKQYLALEKVYYDNDGSHRFNIFNPDEECMKYNVFHKKSSWLDESEYRIFMHDNIPNFVDDKKGLLNKIEYPDTVLSEVIFGYKMSVHEMKIIYDYVINSYTNKDDINFFIVKPNFEKYELERYKYMKC